MLDEGDNWGIDPLVFISRVNSSFDKHMKMDGRTKKVLFHAWINGNWNKRQIDEGILRSNNTTTDSFFKPYLITHRKSDTKKEDERSQTKQKYSNISNSIDEQLNKRRCKAEKFDAIQYSLRPSEEYIAIRSYEYDIWERNEDNMSKSYQDIFQKKDERWKVTHTKYCPVGVVLLVKDCRMINHTKTQKSSFRGDKEQKRFQATLSIPIGRGNVGRPAAKSLGGGTGVRVGKGGRGRRPMEGNDEHVDDLNGQRNDQGMGANGGVEGVNRNVEEVNGGAPDFSTIIA
ncbi:hypothetical protein Tco_0556674 [Tanacetum coccineum]